ncbi:HNH endonuclease [Nocardioides sp. WL0053]|uniref:HNH endonuclease n=1 Tax=Nocardioides jiangsuensis TaxID=2866161 RepID=A0ABS7RLW1_9ACTN|nr:HNH endonuclease [Nocardioides jiangsuensis]MBY9076049.1 HNH endonuclease [Nocardioides jiangsuensis]
MNEGAEDPLALGQRIVAVLETGARTATYKLATLTALIDHCVEHLPADPSAPLEVPVRALAHRVVEIYWRQVRPFEGQQLRQSSQPVARIPRAVTTLREAAGAQGAGLSLDLAMIRCPEVYAATLEDVALTLVRQPIHRLQKLPGGGGVPFLYDDSWMHDQVSRRTLDAHGGVIRLFHGVAYGLARLSGLLKPALEILWVEDVRRMNRHLDANVPDVAGHLFGRDRTALAPARSALKEAFGARCFYCEVPLAANNPVDHVLPWSRLGIDGLANLVLACGRCNGSKLHALPSVELMDRALSREPAVLEQVAEAIAWPTQYDRVVAAARGVYRGEPAGSLTWAGPGRAVHLDLSSAPDWLRV